MQKEAEHTEQKYEAVAAMIDKRFEVNISSSHLKKGHCAASKIFWQKWVIMLLRHNVICFLSSITPDL